METNLHLLWERGSSERGAMSRSVKYSSASLSPAILCAILPTVLRFINTRLLRSRTLRTFHGGYLHFYCSLFASIYQIETGRVWNSAGRTAQLWRALLQPTFASSPRNVRAGWRYGGEDELENFPWGNLNLLSLEILEVARIELLTGCARTDWNVSWCVIYDWRCYFKYYS